MQDLQSQVNPSSVSFQSTDNPSNAGLSLETKYGLTKFVLAVAQIAIETINNRIIWK